MRECIHACSLPESEGAAAGDAFQVVCTAEGRARAVRGRLQALAPWTGGTRLRAERLLAEFARLLDESDCRLVRALRNQRRPWFLDDDPLASVLRRIAVLSAQAHDCCVVVEQVRELSEEIEAIRSRFEPHVPLACQRLVTRRGLSAEALDAILAVDECEAARSRLRSAASRLATWRDDLDAWLQDEERRRGPEAALPATGAASVPPAALEERYELMLHVGSVDREPVQRQAANALRSAASAHLGRVAAAAGARVDDLPYRLVVDGLAAGTSGGFSADEVGNWREALITYHRRARGER